MYQKLVKDVIQSEMDNVKRKYKKFKCKLCGKSFTKEGMSDEHYPARSVGNDDIVAVDLIKIFDAIQSEELNTEIKQRLNYGEQITEITGDIFDNRLSKSVYPNGRTARTLCKKCNTFLGKYDEAYLKFFNVGGEASKIKGFQPETKLQIIKAIFAKFLSIPETNKDNFDFIYFLKNEEIKTYNGRWNLYIIKRNYTTDFMCLPDIGTAKCHS